MASMHVHELGHIVLYVRNVGRSAEFYGKVLGWKQIDTPAKAPIAVFSSGRTHHELLLIEVGGGAKKPTKGYRAGLYHFGLKVGDSDDELRAALKVLHDHTIPVAGATDHGVTHSLYIEDPDGNEVELYVDVPGVDWRSQPELILAPPKVLVL